MLWGRGVWGPLLASPLLPFSQGLPCFEGVVRWLKVAKQRIL